MEHSLCRGCLTGCNTATTATNLDIVAGGEGRVPSTAKHRHHFRLHLATGNATFPMFRFLLLTD